jgi:uncharacterized damage-inducible protein DinB
MMRIVTLLLITLVVAGGLSTALAADYKSEALQRIDALEKKYVGLAETIPADKYTWRPAEGVRSVSEVLMHVAGANYGIPGALGTPPPEGFQFRGYDKSTSDKAEITAKLKESFAHLRKAVEAAGDAEKPTKLFRMDMTARGAVLFMLEHLSEHLGQSIAYARVNGVTPPWSQER